MVVGIWRPDSEFDIALATSDEEQLITASSETDDFCVVTEHLCSAHQAE